MRIVHVSDTHLGYTAYRKVDEESGLNQREIDVYRAFESFVDRTLELRPDLILHSGDLFDSVRPTNRALSFAMDQLHRVSEAGIPMVAIAGNHSTPRLRETGSVFRLFEHIEGIYPVYRGRLERIEIGEMMVTALPHSEPEMMQRGLEELKPSKEFRYNVAIMHAGVVGLGVFRMNEFNERLIKSSYLRGDFDYIALGHYHEQVEVGPTACYAGSTERFSFTEADHEKGFLLIDLENGRRRFEPLEVREMLDLGPVDAYGKDPVALQEEIESVLQTDLHDRIVRLTVRNVSPSTYKGLDFNRIADLTGEALHFERRFEVQQEATSAQLKDASLTSLEQEFRAYLSRRPVEGVDKDRLLDRGLYYLERRLEGSS